jgi:hypothetical protein
MSSTDEPQGQEYFTLTLDTKALHRMDRRQAMDLLDAIRLQVTEQVADERARVAAAEVLEEQARHKPGAPARAAKTLGISGSWMSKLWGRYQGLSERGGCDETTA